MYEKYHQKTWESCKDIEFEVGENRREICWLNQCNQPELLGRSKNFFKPIQPDPYIHTPSETWTHVRDIV